MMVMADNDAYFLWPVYATALLTSLAIGGWLIRFFRRRNVIEDTTQPDHAALNVIQSQKKNVPTMGGLMILAAIIITTLIWNHLRSPYVLIGLVVLVVLGGAGFVDDYIKLKRKPSRGLSKTQKLVVQFILGVTVGWLIVRTRGISSTRVWFPLLRDNLDLGWFYLPWCGFVMAATSNAVNLTDGLDGLAGGLTLIVCIGMAWIAFEWKQPLSVFMNHAEARTFCCTMVATAGAVLGFLWYNRPPAQIFMGDTGSLALGGILAYAALALSMEFFLLMAGAVFFIEELTVAMQIVSFKLTRKRIFPITPIHHYFQVYLKWPEKKIVYMAWVIGLVVAVLGSMIEATR